MEKVSTFAERLSSQLIEKGMSQADLCRLAKLDRSMVSKYLRGLKHPKIDTIRRCAQVLYVSPEWLEGYNVEKKPQPFELSPLEADLLLTFRGCNAETKYIILEFVKNRGSQ